MTETLSQPPDIFTSKEIIQEGNCQILNLSPYNWHRIKDQYPQDLLSAATKLTIMPDFCQGRSSIPTGSIITVDTKRYPEYRRHLIGDIGCGMTWIKSNILYTQFMENLELWDRLACKIKANKNTPGDLGNGNHFLDAAVTGEHGLVHFLVHTGSGRKSGELKQHLNNPFRFDQSYQEDLDRAHQNRQAIVALLQDTYSPLMASLHVQLDIPHNFSMNISAEQITIYKGANRILPGQLSVLPSSLSGPILLLRGNINLTHFQFSLPHGTGRLNSRSREKTSLHAQFPDGNYDFSNFRLPNRPQTKEDIARAFRQRKVYIPPIISNRSIGTEYPSAYRPLTQFSDTLRFLATPLVKYFPIAYIGQL